MTVEEMRKFLALHLLTGIIRKPEISQHWSTDPLLVTPIFNNIMSRNRYQSILEFLHFNDNAFYHAADPDRDRIFKVRPLTEHLVKRFKEAYIPNREILIDEELMLWKGRLEFKQYIPNKRCRFGIKYSSLCVTSGYLWNSYIYLGKVNDSPDDAAFTEELGKSGAIVPKLMSELYNKGYHVYMDNWYTSLKLFQHMECNGTAAYGTARKDRIMPPRTLRNESLKRGENAFRRSGNVMMLRYRDKKEVYFHSTIHQMESARTGKKNKQGEDIIKPVLVNHCSRFMFGTDRNGAMIGNYSSVRKSMNWTT